MEQGDIALRSLLNEMAALGVRVELDGEKLLCHVSNKLPERIEAKIRELKAPLVAYLRRAVRSTAMPRCDFRPAGRDVALSSAQSRILFHEQLYKDSDFYTNPIALRISGAVEHGLLAAAWHEVCERHPSLHSILAESGGSLIMRTFPERRYPLELCDLNTKVYGDGEREFADFLLALVPRLRAEEGSPLASATLYSISPSHHILLITLHHIIADGWSIGMLLHELLETYTALLRGTPSPKIELPGTYADYARWHEAYLSNTAFLEDLKYWTDKLIGAPTGLDPLMVERVPKILDEKIVKMDSGGIYRKCDPLLYEELASWALENGGTMHSTMLAAWYCILHFWTDRQDIVIGTVVAGRPHLNFDSVVGCFINTLPIRHRVNPEQSVSELHDSLLRNLLQAYEHQHCPIEDVVSSVNPRREKGRNPLFNVAFLLQNYPTSKVPPEVIVELIPLERQRGTLDLRLVASMVNQEFVVRLDYNQDMLGDEAAAQLLESYLDLCRCFVDTPEVPLVELRSAVNLDRLQVRKRAVVASTFTAEPLQDAFEFWRTSLDLPFSLTFAGYDQIFQELLSSTSLMRRHSDHNCVLLRLDDWLYQNDFPSRQALLDKVGLFIDACVAYDNNSYVPLTIWLCPNSTRSLRMQEASTALRDAQTLLGRNIVSLKRIALRTAEDYTPQYNLEAADDEFMDRIGHVPYRSKVYTGLGTLIARELSASIRPVLKAVVLDADNTLWKGISGEDGFDNLEFDTAALELQKFFAAIHEKGVALCLCSKNVAEDVRAVFDKRHESILNWSDFSAIRINWNPKSQNIREIAADLNIGLDSIAFVDDNPVECAEVEANCPEVLCLTLPEVRNDIPAFLHSVWELDVRSASTEAQLRLNTYQLNSERDELRRNSIDTHAYLRALSVETTIRPMIVADIERAAELTNRTTQFNFTGRKKTTREMATFIAGTEQRGYVVEVRDKFGDYGLTGVVLCSFNLGNWSLETFLLSCRVLGKGVEAAVVVQLESFIRSVGGISLEVVLVKTARNQPACEFARSYFGPPAEVNERVSVYRKFIA